MDSDSKSSSRRKWNKVVGKGCALTFAVGGLAASRLLAKDDVEEESSKDNLMEHATMRSVKMLLPLGPNHVVGDGFFVRMAFQPSVGAELISPFLLMDHAPPKRFSPTSIPRGVGEHPHRGFETVTFAYQGEIDHRDSAGGGGRIGPGDVQWMTAGSGLVHEEKHSQSFTESGGVFEMVQLWVNLPASHKMTKPRYQGLLDASFPRVELGAATGRLIAGELNGAQGPAKTYSPMTVFDVSFAQAGLSNFRLPSDWNVLVVTQQGELSVAGQVAGAGRVVVMDQVPGEVVIEGKAGSRALILAGQPLGEPVVAQGPFVMNTREELVQAIRDYQSGKMGHL